MMVSTVRSVSCLLFFYSRCPRAQPFVKVGGTCPPNMEGARRYAESVCLIDKKTNNVCLLFKFSVNIQTARNVMTYRHSPRNSPSPLY